MDNNIVMVEEHEIRSVWPNEEHDFTKWLSNNIELLGAEIGIEIEEADSEQPVGDFSADIVGKEMNTGEPVVIENQYGKTDHDHLGKLLTYSAGMGAEFTIWIAETFRAEHRSVLEWLNESGPKDIRFFGIQPKVVTIEGCDTKGFAFKVLVEPNDWEREFTESLSETEKAYKEFYTELAKAYSERRPDWYRVKAQPQPWLSFGAGMAGVSIGWNFHQGPEFSVDVYIDTGDKTMNEEIFDELITYKAEIESALGEELVWQELPDKRASRIKMTKDISGRITELDTVEKNNLIEWGVESMDEFQTEFERKISRLDVERPD